MFTGIIDHLGQITALQRRADKAFSLTINTQFKDCELGESISCDGICLTVTGSQPGLFTVDLSPETINCTRASDWRVGEKLHLERALRLGDRLGGHWVTGHVDTTVSVADARYEGDCLRVDIQDVQPQHARYLVDKGSVTLDGVSLTVNTVNAAGFSVMLIPQTLAITHFDELQLGQLLHIEYDCLLKWAARDRDLKEHA